MSSLRFGEKAVIATDPDFDAEDVDMDFRLTFDGCLFSTGSKPRPDHVHKVRLRFHTQLRHLWSVSPILNVSPEVRELEKKRADAFRKGNYRFVPLVTREDQFLCVVDILLLRPTPEATPLYRAGDLDGQIATVFDALSAPRHLEQLAGNETPQDGEDPFYCLLEDDSLISGIAVETGVLLESTRDGIDGNAARAVVRVRVNWPPKDLGYSRWA